MNCRQYLGARASPGGNLPLRDRRSHWARGTGGYGGQTLPTPARIPCYHFRFLQQVELVPTSADALRTQSNLNSFEKCKLHNVILSCWASY